MIRISVTLISAVNGRETELARMDISNNGESGSAKVGHYIGHTYIGRSKEQLDRHTISKVGQIRNWRRNDFHVWNLVRIMLTQMGYTKGAPLTDWSYKP